MRAGKADFPAFFEGDELTYEKIIKGEFISRPNRFIAQVMVDGKEETVHVKNTGRGISNDQSKTILESILIFIWLICI